MLPYFLMHKSVVQKFYMVFVTILFIMLTCHLVCISLFLMLKCRYFGDYFCLISDLCYFVCKKHRLSGVNYFACVKIYSVT